MDSTADFWTPTIQAFEPLQIGTPVLTEKLLQRPPFRFIHDIVSSVDRRFQAYAHLFTPEELDSTLLDTKEKKIQYLDKLIAFVALLLGRPVNVSSKKIVAGSEADKTNLFLQDLALAVGYAQQYRAQQQSSAAAAPPPPAAEAPPPPPPPPPPPAPPTDPECVPPPPPMAGDKQKLKINLDMNQQKQKTNVLSTASAFMNKITNLGLDLQSGPNISEAIRNMEKELKGKPTIATEPSPMSAQALEMAIQRQMDSIQQLKLLIDENNLICNSIVEASMSVF